MSLRRNAGGRPAGGPPPERKAPAGPVITPQVLMVVYFLLVVVAVAMYWNMVIKANNEKQAAADSRAKAAEANIKTYKMKGGKLEIAKRLNKTVSEKLKDTAYMFLTDQSSVIPFYEEVFFPVLFSAGFGVTDETQIKVQKYTFKVNMAMNPFNTIPPSRLFDNSTDAFSVSYEPEQNGTPTEVPLDTRPTDFLTPYEIKLIKWQGSYEDVKRFVRNLQLRQNKTLFTVHCMKNAEDANIYGYRTITSWDITLSVYFINPEANASGDVPPGLPGSSSC
ncbi:MAG: hypothetical protein M3R04_03820 [bacterium]|nr:hypothetical protein [bacterium]